MTKKSKPGSKSSAPTSASKKKASKAQGADELIKHSRRATGRLSDVELYTVSAEHQRKNEELTDRDTDIDVLLQSCKIGTIHLDDKLNLRRYTNNARSVFNILPQDVGRPINHITVRTVEEDVLDLVYKTNQNHEVHETQVIVDGDVFLLRIMPYREQENHPSGVLITIIDITDVELVRSQLAALDVQYKDIVENTDSFIVRWDAKSNNILFCNEPYARRWGSTVSELIGRSIYDIRDREARKEIDNFIFNIKPNKTAAGVFTTRVADGSIQSARVFTRAISHDGITTDEYQTNGFDCTEEHIYRVALDKLFTVFSNGGLTFQEKLEHLLDVGLEYFHLDTALISMVVGDILHVKCVSSKKAVNFKVGEVIPLSEMFSSHLGDSDSFLAIDDVTKNFASGSPYSKIADVESYVGAAIQTASGPYGTVSFSSTAPRGRPFSAQDENFSLLISSWIGFLLGNQEQMDFMSNQNEYYQNLFETVPAMLFLSDADGLIISASNRLCTKLHLDAESLPGKTCHRVFEIDDKAALKAALTTGSAEHLPLVFTLSDGSTLEVELNCGIKNVGTLQGVRMVVLTDVSDRNRAARSVADQNRLLETANENLNQFAFIASHDLQEPLRKIQQFSSFLEDDLEGKLDKDAGYHLNVIVEAADRMSTLIRDLLRFSGASQEEPQHESVDLNKLLNEVVSELELRIDDSKAVIKIEKLPTVDGDKGMLRQLFVNLIGNGIKYRSQERLAQISVRGIGEGLQEGVVVSDNGIGFEMKFARKIFEPFNRLHRSKDYKGNGIGLAICSTVCDKHGWILSAESEPDVGSTFKIDFSQ